MGKACSQLTTMELPRALCACACLPGRTASPVWGDGFSFGGAFTTGRNVGGLSVRGQTESRSFIFFTPETVNGKQTRANGELTWMLGPAAIRAEYDQTHQERRNLGAGGTDLPGVVAQGYMAQVTFLLTGETKPEAGAVAPRFQLFRERRRRAGLGAWELKLRYANLNIADGSPKSNRAETLFFGVNWYLNRFMTHMVDFGYRADSSDRLRTPRPGDDNFLCSVEPFAGDLLRQIDRIQGQKFAWSCSRLRDTNTSLYRWPEYPWTGFRSPSAMRFRFRSRSSAAVAFE